MSSCSPDALPNTSSDDDDAALVCRESEHKQRHDYSVVTDYSSKPYTGVASMDRPASDVTEDTVDIDLSFILTTFNIHHFFSLSSMIHGFNMRSFSPETAED